MNKYMTEMFVVIVCFLLLAGNVAGATEDAKLIALDGAADDWFGNAVSVDGDTVVIGVQGDDDNGSASGSAYVFTHSGSTWTQQDKLTASDGAEGDQFGVSVSVDGDTVVIGAHLDDDNGPDSGSAYVFTRRGGTWTQQAKLTASDGAAGDYFGWSVSVDGNTVVIGTAYDDDAGDQSGSAYVFTRRGGTWTQQTKLTASDGAEGDWFGHAVSVDGNTVVISAPGDDGAGYNIGSTYVFTRRGGTWTQQAKLTADDGAADDYFGWSVSIDGNTVVIGAWGDNDAGSHSGSAYVFTRRGGTWTQQAKLTAGDGAEGDEFGFSVSVDGDTAVISARGDDSYKGSAYVFTRSGNTWTQQDRLTAGDGAEGDEFGFSISVDGDTAVIGAHVDDDNGPDSGSAYVHSLAEVAHGRSKLN